MMKCASEMAMGMMKMAKSHRSPKSCGPESKTQNDLIATLRELGNFKTLLLAAQKADLVETLRAKGPFTVFAPTDEAFARVPKETLNGLFKDSAKLKKTLSHHVLDGLWKPEGWMETISVRALEGPPLRIVVGEDKITVDQTEVKLRNISAANGLIHVINAVLLAK